MPVLVPITRTRAQRRALALLALGFALTALLFWCGPAQAQLTVHGSRLTAGELTVSWRSDADGSSALCWYDTYPSGAPNLAIDECVQSTSSSIGTDHSQSVRGLPAGEYWYVAASRSHTTSTVEFSSPVPFTISSSAGGSGTVSEFVTDGSVVTAATTNGTPTSNATRAWVAGDFAHVGERSASGTIVAAADADRPSSRGLPSITNSSGPASIDVVTDDGAGGWYVAGDFTAIGGVPVQDVAHILPDGGIDFDLPAPRPSFNPGLGIGNDTSGTGGVIHALDFDPNIDALWVGGEFSTWNGSAVKRNLVRIEESGSRVTGAGAFAMSKDIVEPVRAIAVDYRTTTTSKGDVYVGGDFDQAFGPGVGYRFSHVVKFDADGSLGCEGVLNVDLSCFAMDSIRLSSSPTTTTVRSLEFVVDGLPRLLIGGRFDEVSHTDPDDVAEADSPVTQRGFTIVRADLGTRDAIDGLNDGRPWGGIVGLGTPGGVVNDIEFDAAAGVAYLGGDFANGFATGRADLAAINVHFGAGTTSTVSGFEPRFEASSGAVTTVEKAGSTLFVGGAFSTSYATTSPVAQFDNALTLASSTAARLLGNPIGQAVDKPVRGLASSDGQIYVGGDFTMFDGATTKGIAAIDIDTGTGEVTADPGFSVITTNGPSGGVVRALSYDAGRLAIGGDFTSFGGTNRGRVALSNAATGAPMPLAAHTDNTVNAVLLAGGNLWIGGAFTTLASGYNGSNQTGCIIVSCRRLAVVDVTSGTAVVSHPSGPDGVVWSLVGHGTDVYAGGAFTNFGLGVSRSGVAKFDASSGSIDSWNPSFTPHARALLVRGNYLYVGGANHANGTAAHRFARVDLTSGTVQTYGSSKHVGLIDGSASHDHDVVALAPGPTPNRVYVGGAFDDYGLQGATNQQSRIAMVDTSTGRVVSTFNPRPTTTGGAAGAVSSLASLGTGAQHRLVIGGVFVATERQSARGGIAVAQPPTDHRKPVLAVHASPVAGTKSISAGDGTIIVKNVTGSAVEVRVDAHDSFVRRQASSAAVSGLKRVQFPARPNASWAIDGGATAPTFLTSRGLTRSCEVVNGLPIVASSAADNLDLANDDGDLLEAITNDHASDSVRCTWRGFLYAPDDAPASIAVEAFGSGLSVSFTRAGTTTHVLSGAATSMTLSPTVPTLVEATWVDEGAAAPSVRLAWKIGTATRQTIPPGAFTAASSQPHVYQLINGTQADTPITPITLGLTAVDAEDNASDPAPSATVRVALDKAPPVGDDFRINGAAAPGDTIAANSIAFDVVTGNDRNNVVGAQYVAGTDGRRILVEYTKVKYPLLGILGAPQCDTSTIQPVTGYNGDIPLSDDIPWTNNVKVFTFNDPAYGKGDGCYRFTLEVEDELGNRAASKYADGKTSSDWLRVDRSSLVSTILGGTTQNVGGLLGGVGEVLGGVESESSGARRIFVELRRPDGTLAAVPCDSNSASKPPVYVTGRSDFPANGDMNGDAVVDASDDFAIIDNGNGTYKVRCLYDSASPTFSVSGTKLLDGPYDLYNVVTPQSGADKRSAPGRIVVDNHKPEVSVVVTGDFSKRSYVAPSSPSVVWIDPLYPAEFDVDVRTNDDLHGEGTGAQKATFTRSADWSAPGSGVGLDTDTTPRVDADPHMRHFDMSYSWIARGSAPSSDLPMSATVEDKITPAHDVTAPFTVKFDASAPIVTVAYGKGEESQTNGHPNVSITAVDPETSIHKIYLTRYDHELPPLTASAAPECPSANDPVWDAVTPGPVVEIDPSQAMPYEDVTVQDGHCYIYTAHAVNKIGLGSAEYDPTLMDPTLVARTNEVAVTITQDDSNPIASVDEATPNAADVIHVKIQRPPTGSDKVRIVLRDPRSMGRQQIALQRAGSTADRSDSVVLEYDAATPNATIDVNVFAIDDTWDDAPSRAVMLELASSDPGYASMDTTSYPVMVSDNDTAGAWAVAAAPIELNEGSTAGAQVEIGLRTTPFGAGGHPMSGSVVARVTTGDVFVGQVDGALPSNNFEITFDAAHPRRMVTLIPVDDQLVGSHALQQMSVTLVRSSDPAYAGVQFPPVSVQVVDEDTASVRVTSVDPGAMVDGALRLTEGGASEEVEVSATKAARGDIVIKPVVKKGAGVTVSPNQRVINASVQGLSVDFEVRVTNDQVDNGASYEGLVAWTVTSSESGVRTGVEDTKIVVTDDDEAPVRTPRDTTTPIGDPAPVEPQKPSPVPPKAPRIAKPEPSVPQPAPQVQQPILPMAGPAGRSEPPKQRRKPKPEVEAEQAGVTDWVKEHKTASAAGAAAAAGAAVAAKSSLLGALKGLVGGLDHLMDRLDPRNFNRKNRDRLRQLRDKAKRLRGERERPMGRKRRRGAEDDILDELEHKYDADYDDPLEAFERGPRGNRPDVLRDVETRLRGFDLDDAA